MNASTDWGSALAILAAGLILGLLVFFTARRRKSSAAGKRLELEARRDALLQQLRDLAPDATDDERTSLESETAEALRAIDALPPVTGDAPVPRPRTAVTGFVWGMACTLIAGGIVYYGSTFVRERETPASPQNAGDAQGSNDVQQLEAAVKAEPNNADHRIALAKLYFGRNDMMAAFEQTNAVLAQDPNEPRALTYNAVVRMSMGELDGSRKMLEQATQRDPQLLDAWVALASVRERSGDHRGASAAIEAAIAQHPEEEKRLRDVFVELQKQTSPSGAPAVASSNLPPDHPPMPGMNSAPMTSSSAPIHLTLALDPASRVKSGILYIIARGGEAGHPVAVKRIETNAFPVIIDFGAGDSMMGGTLPSRLSLEARLDSDGDAGTSNPADPRASVDGVTAGATVTMTLAHAK